MPLPLWHRVNRARETPAVSTPSFPPARRSPLRPRRPPPKPHIGLGPCVPITLDTRMWGGGNPHGLLMLHAANMDCPPALWPISPRAVVYQSTVDRPPPPKGLGNRAHDAVHAPRDGLPAARARGWRAARRRDLREKRSPLLSSPPHLPFCVSCLVT